MALVRVERTLALEYAAHEGKGGVCKRHSQCQQGHDKGDDGLELEKAHDSRDTQNKAQKLRAYVAHEDYGGVEVVGDEAQTCAGEGGQNNGYHRVGNQQGNHQHGQ